MRARFFFSQSTIDDMKFKNPSFLQIFLNLSISGLILLNLGSCKKIASPTRETNPENTSETDPCDHPDAPISCCFQDVPDLLSYTMYLCAENEPGEKLIISGFI